MDLAGASAAILAGELIVMPTETVYGLAADAGNPEAVARIFEVKGRPESNPLIVHVNSIDMARRCVREWPPLAQQLADQFWPGPLTLVLPKSNLIPLEVTAGLETVGVRMPRHPVALDLIGLADRPLAAPSANPANAVSPTRVGHLAPSILAGVAGVLDAGPCEAGIESTVVEVSEDRLAILRPGAISREALAQVANLFDSKARERAPGGGAKHYAPARPVVLVERLEPEDTGLGFGEPLHSGQVRMPSEATEYAKMLYDALHRLDVLSPDQICVERPPQTLDWEAVWDRLDRAASPR